MDAVFFLEEEARAVFLRTIAQSTGCTYICLWSYVPLLSDCLVYVDGWYNIESNQPSSSSGSHIHRLFDAYRQTQHTVNNGFVPGLAFKDGIPYLEVSNIELLQRSSNVSQQNFYQQARIKSAAFLGCRCGEIEIGMPTSIPVNMKFDISNWAQQLQFKEQIPPPLDQEWQSSSSSSFKSLSGSPENSTILFGMTSGPSYLTEALKEAQLEPAIRPTSAAVSPHQQQSLAAYDQIRIQHLNPDSDNAVITKAMLAVMSSPSPSSSYTQQYSPHSNQRTGAFKEYTPALNPKVQMKVSSSGRQNMFKRSISIMRSVDQSLKEELMQGNTSTSSQLQHKISEKKRREKLNESFQELRSVLPPSTKKDKATILSNTLDYLETLKFEVTELRQKNQLLEERKTHVRGVDQDATDEKIDIRITHLSEATSEEQEIELRVTVRGDCDIMDLIIDILEYLKLGKEATLVSMDADTESLETVLINRVILRLHIKTSEWDEPAFQEALTKIVADVAD